LISSVIVMTTPRASSGGGIIVDTVLTSRQVDAEVASVVHIDGRDRLLAHLHRPASQVYCATHAGGDARIRWGMTATGVVR
jgi:hypothetical protein